MTLPRSMQSLVGLYGEELAERDGGWICHYCGCELTRGKKPIYSRATVDHLTPVTRGGLTELDNLTLACFACNHEKYRRTEAEYLDYLGSKS